MTVLDCSIVRWNQRGKGGEDFYVVFGDKQVQDNVLGVVIGFEKCFEMSSGSSEFLLLCGNKISCWRCETRLS